MKVGSYVILTVLVLVAITGFVLADRLPNQTPENQVFSVDTVIDATGAVETGTDMTWLVTTPGAVETGTLAHHNADYDWLTPQGKVIADVDYQDTILTNGGKLIENKNFDFNSKNQALGLYNIDTSKILTYASTKGAHMAGEEVYTLDVAGEAKAAPDNIRCVFSTPQGIWLPPFCNIVSVRNALLNINSAQISDKGQLRAVAATDDIPATLNYQIAVTPDANSNSGFAEGTVSTTYAGSIMEARGSGGYWTNNAVEARHIHGQDVQWDELTGPDDGWINDRVAFQPSANNTWKDATTVTGGIRNFQKAFGYKSGFQV